MPQTKWWVRPAKNDADIESKKPDPKTQKLETSDTPKRASKDADAMPADSKKATSDG